MNFIDRLESKFGRFAIPGLIQTIAVFQLGVLALILMMSKETAETYLQFLMLDTSRVLRGEIWRLVTHVFVPRSFSLIWAVFGTLVMMWIGRGLEQAWTAFRVNLYVMLWMAAVTAGNLFFGWQAEALFLYQSLFFAFAVFYPNEEIYVYFILPVKVKWLAMISAALTGFAVMQDHRMLLPVLLGHLNFLITFTPGLLRDLKHASKVGQRRARYTASTRGAGDFFHQCSVCKKTEIDDPQLEFRVLASGDEICSACRARRDAKPG